MRQVEKQPVKQAGGKQEAVNEVGIEAGNEPGSEAGKRLAMR